MTDTPEPDVRELAAKLIADQFCDEAYYVSWERLPERNRDYYRAFADEFLAAVTPVIRRQVAETLRLVGKGRASYLAAYRSTEGWNETRTILDAEAVSYATAAELAEGATEPLYSLLPSWMWPDELHEGLDAAIARSHSTQPETGQDHG